LIDQNERFAVCAETDDPRNAIALFERHQPKIVILDLVLAQGDGFTFIKSLIKLSPAALILVLSSDEGVMSICRALRAGAVGYLTVEDGDLELPIALDTIAAGAYYVSKRLWNVVLKSFARGALRQIKADANLLTDRELEVFTLIGRGAGVVEMAEKLGVSGKTVETHQMRIKQKLNLGSAADLRKYAVHSIAKM
jgi:DNA-binding NarL/FixJ family response regulator